MPLTLNSGGGVSTGTKPTCAGGGVSTGTKQACAGGGVSTGTKPACVGGAVFTRHHQTPVYRALLPLCFADI